MRTDALIRGLLIACSFGGAVRAGSLRVEVVDADSGRALPCRASIQSADGTWHFPKSTDPAGSVVEYRRKSLTDASIVEMHATISAHPWELELPPGEYTIRVQRGKEYHPWSGVVRLGTEPERRRIALRRWIDMAALGWFSGETHVHRSLEELPNVMLAEDLNVAFPITDWVREAFVSPVAARDATFRDPGWPVIEVDRTHLIATRNTEYEIFTVAGKPHTLGAFFVIQHRTPLDLGTPPAVPVARRAHDEGALIELDKHNWPWSMAIVPVMQVDLFELSNNHVWETDFGFRTFGELPAEYMEVERNEKGFTERGWIEFGFQNYYALLNCGFRLRPTAGTASGVHPVPLGFGRVYVHLDRPLTVPDWLNGLDAGRSFVTTGPMLLLTLAGQDPGHRFDHSADERRSHRLTGRAVSAVPLERIEVIVNGQVARSVTPANRRTESGAFESPIDESLTLDESSWLAVRCFEDRPEQRPRFAHTAPWFVDIAGKPLRPRRAEVEYLCRRVEEQIARSERILPEAAIAEYREALRAYQALLPMSRP